MVRTIDKPHIFRGGFTSSPSQEHHNYETYTRKAIDPSLYEPLEPLAR